MQTNSIRNFFLHRTRVDFFFEIPIISSSLKLLYARLCGAYSTRVNAPSITITLNLKMKCQQTEWDPRSLTCSRLFTERYQKLTPIIENALSLSDNIICSPGTVIDPTTGSFYCTIRSTRYINTSAAHVHYYTAFVIRITRVNLQGDASCLIWYMSTLGPDEPT